MDFRNILNEIEKADPEVYEKLSPRRSILKSFGAKVAVAALPVALGSLFKKAYGKTTTNAVVDALNFALKLEYMEYNYYHVANNTGGLIPAADLAGFQTIEAQELAHINFLKATINTLGGTPYTPPNYNPSASNPDYIPSGTYDFTAKALYPVFNDYPTFLIIAQIFEDTCVHSYKGYIPTVIANRPLLTQVMQLQCIEARHAAHVRFVRRFVTPKQPDYPAPWITNNIPPVTSLQSYYLGEELATQQGIVITSLPDVTGTIPLASATAAFDEAYTQTTVAPLIAPFFV
jgi:hypothetical protein